MPESLSAHSLRATRGGARFVARALLFWPARAARRRGLEGQMKAANGVRPCLLVLSILMLAPCVPARADTPVDVPPVARKLSLSGPRFGVTFLSPGLVSHLDDEYDIRVGSVVSQFGWQFEKRLYSGESGLSTVTEWVVLVGGVEQGLFLPSLSWVVGLRTSSGAEFGVGPNFTAAGTGLVLAAGRTFRAGALNLPVNLAVVPSKSGVRISLLVGFNTRND
jgi:hypothetical protein